MQEGHGPGPTLTHPTTAAPIAGAYHTEKLTPLCVSIVMPAHSQAPVLDCQEMCLHHMLTSHAKQTKGDAPSPNIQVTSGVHGQRTRISIHGLQKMIALCQGDQLQQYNQKRDATVAPTAAGEPTPPQTFS